MAKCLAGNRLAALATMYFRMKLLIVVILLTLLSNTSAANILALMDVHSQNNYHQKIPLILALNKAGHNVTLICTNEEKKVDFNTVHHSTIYELMKGDNYWTPEDKEEESYFKTVSSFLERSVQRCENALQNKGIKELLDSSESTKFDLAIFEPAHGECFLGMLHKFGSPAVIALNAVTNPQWTNYMIGNPSYPAYMPNTFLPYSHQTSLFCRMYNILLSFYVQYQWNVNYLPKVNAVVQRYFGSSAPSMTAILQNVSAVMVHTDPSFDYSYLQGPARVSVAGIHIGKPKRLSKGLKTFLDRAKYGVILFSLGGDLRMRQEIKQTFWTAFLKLDQRVLWNGETDAQLSKNKKIKTGQWISHTDLLAHPNMRLIITQGSLVSIQEATSQGIPIIGIPFGREQHSNMQKVTVRGTGVQLDYKTISKTTILAAVQEILQNASYAENARKLSVVFNDHPKTPMERALYCCDYVIRHRGAPHLHSAFMGLEWYEYFHQDVLILIFAVLAILTILTRYCYKVQTKKKSRAKSKRR